MSALRDALRDLPDPVFADLLEGDEAYLVAIDMPGATSDTVDVRTEGNTLVIEARREKDVPSEFRYVEESRSLFLDVELPLPPDVTDRGANASVSQGVLEVRLPKQSAAPETTIPVGEE